MENATLTIRPKQVGNSLAFFIPAEIRNELGLSTKKEAILHIHQKKDLAPLMSLFGACKKKLGPWNEKEDRLDARY